MQNIPGHALEHEKMKGQHAVPVQAAQQTFGPESGRLPQKRYRLVFGLNNFKLEPGFAGQFHFGVQ